jgi:sec-independent protein translocase protein TatA
MVGLTLPVILKDIKMIEQTQNILAFMMGPFEWGVVLVVAVLVFGRRLPEIARKAGKSLSSFKKGVKEGQNEISDVINSEDDEKNDTDQTEDDVS